jgi:hypothetical protein
VTSLGITSNHFSMLLVKACLCDAQVLRSHRRRAAGYETLLQISLKYRLLLSAQQSLGMALTLEAQRLVGEFGCFPWLLPDNLSRIRNVAGHLWLMPVILTTQEPEIRTVMA